MIELPKEFYERDTLEVTKDLIGKVMVYTRPDGVKISTIINEAEAYSEEEESCHAYRGRSERNKAMFLDGGHIYIYKIYGMHQCLNFVTEHNGKGCAVLLRGVLPYENTQHLNGDPRKPERHLNGPAKLMKSIGISFDLYGRLMMDEDCPLKIYDKGFTPKDLQATTRIGITKAKDFLWRFIAKRF